LGAAAEDPVARCHSRRGPLVTCTNGFIGSNLYACLARRPLVGDITQPQTLAPAFEGAGIVYHPQVSIRDGIRRTIARYRDHTQSTRSLTLDMPQE
jgi:hypothetical protein